MARVEQVLRDDEVVLFEGRPRGAAALFRSGDLFFLVNWVLGGLALAWYWTEHLGRPLLGDGPWAPSPLAIFPFLAALLLYQWASFGARRYVLTTQRVLLVRGVVWLGVRERARSGAETARRRLDGDVVLEGLADGSPLLLPGLDASDLDSLQRALSDDAQRRSDASSPGAP